MKRSTRRGGYTIVEVMIFLVITGALLSSALLVFSGRQRRTQFTQGVREIEAQLKTVINETASGYYPNNADMNCTSSNGNGPQLSKVAVGSGNEQGTNEGCLFLGRVIQFTSTKNYNIYAVVGQQTGFNGKQVTTLGPDQNEARQTLITPTIAAPNLPDATLVYELPGGITVEKIEAPSISPPPTTIGAFGFISSLGSYNGDSNDLVSGSSSISLVPLTSTALASSSEDIVNRTKALVGNTQYPGKIVICLRSAGGDRRAAITIGGNGNNTGTEVFIDNVPAEC